MDGWSCVRLISGWSLPKKCGMQTLFLYCRVEDKWVLSLLGRTYVINHLHDLALLQLNILYKEAEIGNNPILESGNTSSLHTATLLCRVQVRFGQNIVMAVGFGHCSLGHGFGQKNSAWAHLWFQWLYRSLNLIVHSGHKWTPQTLTPSSTMTAHPPSGGADSRFLPRVTCSHFRGW